MVRKGLRDFRPLLFQTGTDEKIAFLSGDMSSYGLDPRRGRNQGPLLPVVLDNIVPADHVCRVIDALVERLMVSELGFERAQSC